MSFLLAKQILELFFVIFLGWLIVKTHILKAKDSQVLSKVLIYLINPCVMISSFQIKNTPQVSKGVIMSILLAFFIHIILLIITSIVVLLFKLNNIENASIMYSNSGNLIIPIVTSIFGKEYLIYTAGFMVVQNILMWTHSKIIISEEKNISLKKIFGNINIISVFIGLIFFIFQIKLPVILVNSMKSIGSTIGIFSMLIAGMLMAKLDVKNLKNYKKLPLVIFFRLIFIPLTIVIFMRFVMFYFPAKELNFVYTISLLAAITPTAATITNQCQIYNKDSVYSNTIYLITTLLCIITMPILLAIFQFSHIFIF